VKALVVQNPWAWCIAQAWRDPLAKQVENRTWLTSYRGDLAIVAGRKVDEDALDHPQVAACVDRWWGSNAGSIAGPHPWEVGPGAVVCVVDFHDVCDRSGVGAGGCHCGRWAVRGAMHWRFRQTRLLDRPVPVRGMQGLFDLPAEVAVAVREQLAVWA
jgi:hypothetical protein